MTSRSSSLSTTSINKEKKMTCIENLKLLSVKSIFVKKIEFSILNVCIFVKKMSKSLHNESK